MVDSEDSQSSSASGTQLLALNRVGIDASTSPTVGMVRKIFRSEGFGFIVCDQGRQVFFDRRTVGGGLEFTTLMTGARVVFFSPPGAPSANAVWPASEATQH